MLRWLLLWLLRHEAGRPERGRCPAVLLRDLHDQLLTDNADAGRRLDAEAHAALVDAEHNYADAAINDNGITGAAAQDQHGYRAIPMTVCSISSATLTRRAAAA